MGSSVALTFYGGTNEIGGNAVLLEDFGYDVKFFLDFGTNMNKFYEHYDKGENPSSLKELLKLGLLPFDENFQIKNLYSEHYIFNHEEKKYKQKIKECENKVDPDSNVDGILISHAHKDHFYGLPFVNRNIPIYTGEITKKIILAHYNSMKSQMDTFYHGLKWILFKTGDILRVKELEIVPIHVDHSIPAAYGFILKTSAGIIVYSGDFRMHGPLSWMTVDLIKKVKEIRSNTGKGEYISISKQDRVKALICEGTHVQKGAIESERNVKRDLRVLFKNMQFDYIIVKYDRVDWDRFRTFSDIAKRFKWKYVISEKDAYFYYLLNKGATYETMRNPDIINDDHIYIISQEKMQFPWQEEIRQNIYKNNKQERLLNYSQLKELNGKFFLYITSLPDKLKDSLPLKLRGLFVSSSIDPYAEEYFDNASKIGKELLKEGIPCYRIHASAHAKPHDIIKFVKEINPEILIPIHTQNSEMFVKFFESPDLKVIIPEKCKAISINV